MNRFMANIRLEGLDMDTRMKLLPAEQEGVKVLEERGVLLHSFIKLDMSGIFMVMVANDEEDFHNQISFLPYYPYMKIELVAIR